MSDAVKSLSGKLKQQVDSANESAAQLAKAGKGLVRKVSKEAEKQFCNLVETGEAQKEKGQTIVEQVKSSFDGQFDDVKSSIERVKLAGLGLLTKARGAGEKVFKELVELGEGQQSSVVSQDSKKATA
jgi:polyhydroxyalkanoate synthesis regulator phasin